MTDAVRADAQAVILAFAAKGLTLATAESCTGGLIAAALTDIAGSSAVVDRGFVTYSNAAKTEVIGVPAAMIAAHGAVSEEVARAMATGALAAAGTSVAVSVTGIAGPGGGSAEKPVGLVHFGLAGRDGARLHEVRRFGALSREAIRGESVSVALGMLLGWAAGQAAGTAP